MECTELVDLAAEFAAGNLCGEERAAAIAHLDSCPSCQQVVNSLAAVFDQVLLLAPPVEPPAGFEERVLASLPSEPSGPRRVQRPRRRRALLATVAALVVAISAVFLVDIGSSDDPAFADADMRTISGDVVGHVVVHREESTSVLITLPGWSEQIERSAGYSVRIETDDGGVTTRPASFSDDASWAATLDIDATSIATVSVVGADGYVWCHARFG